MSDYPNPHRGPLIFWLGMGSLICCCLFVGLPAWIMGQSDLKKIKAGHMDPHGEELTRAGMICGIIGTLLSAAIALMMIVIFALAIGNVQQP